MSDRNVRRKYKSLRRLAQAGGNEGRVAQMAIETLRKNHRAKLSDLNDDDVYTRMDVFVGCPAEAMAVSVSSHRCECESSIEKGDAFPRRVYIDGYGDAPSRAIRLSAKIMTGAKEAMEVAGTAFAMGVFPESTACLLEDSGEITVSSDGAQGVSAPSESLTEILKPVAESAVRSGIKFGERLDAATPPT